MSSNLAPDIEKLRGQFFPFQTQAGVTIKAVSQSEMNAFIKEAHQEVFPNRGDNIPFRPDENRVANMLPMRNLYERTHHEFFLFFDTTGKPIGWHMGEAEDSITFYMRNTGVLPAAQNSGIYKEFFKRLIDYLSAIGYERITSQHQATNRRILILKLKEGFSIAGFELTERWGPLVKLVKLIPHDRRESFYKHFGMLSHME